MRSKTLYIFKTQLEGTQPAIWRRFIVSSTTTLPKLHNIMQIMMGWTNSHLHQFIINNQFYGEPDPEYEMIDGPTVIDYKNIKLSKLIKDGITTFKYLYDFGDSWMHTIIFEEKAKDEKDILTGDEEDFKDLYDEINEVLGEEFCPKKDVQKLERIYRKLIKPGSPFGIVEYE